MTVSADNYLYVHRAEDMWTVTMEFASDDVGPVRRSDPIFETWEEAYAYAQEWEQWEMYPIEYGIRVERNEPQRASGEKEE